MATISSFISQLHKEIEDCEAEQKYEQTKRRNTNHALIARLGQYIKTHHWHVTNLELVMRHIHNELIDPYTIGTVLDGVEDYLQHYRDKDYIVDDGLYDDLNLDDSSEEVTAQTTLQHSASSAKPTSLTSPSAPLKISRLSFNES